MTSVRKRSSRLSMRKGRSIVHKNLEDNYGAVITANHEAIAQILEQVSFTSLTRNVKIYTDCIFRFARTVRPLRACEVSPLP